MTEPPDVLLVDWLGRGGIAHTTVAWQQVLSAMGRSPLVITRGQRELEKLVPAAATVVSKHGRVAEQLKLARAIASTIRSARPDWLVLAGSVAPQIELGVVLAAKAARTRVCMVAHESEPPNDAPLAFRALRALWRLSDVVVYHSRYVGNAIRQAEANAVLSYVAHPKTACLIEQMQSRSPLFAPDGRLLALTFGQLQKAYKGTAVISDIAEASGDEWRFALAGSGIPQRLSPAVERHEGFFDAGELAATVAAADVVLLPYTRASQSGAVVLAQEVGTPVVASGVGGIPEQIDDGVTGLLLSPGAPVSEWMLALQRLSDPVERQRLARTAMAHIDEQHSSFVRSLEEVFGE